LELGFQQLAVLLNGNKYFFLVMRHLKVFIKGDTINLCKPTLEFARKSNWYSWFNDKTITKYLLSKYQKEKNTPKKQEKFFLAENKKRLILIISTKKKIYKGVVSLSFINKERNSCDIAIVTDTGIEPEVAPYAALEAIARITEYAFKHMNIKKIYGTGHINLRNWQQRMELFGYRVDAIKKNEFMNNKLLPTLYTISCCFDDYVQILKTRNKFWDSLSNMKKRIDKLPKITFRDMLIKFLDSEGEKYYKKIFKI
jgi:hypothetical protein